MLTCKIFIIKEYLGLRNKSQSITQWNNFENRTIFERVACSWKNTFDIGTQCSKMGVPFCLYNKGLLIVMLRFFWWKSIWFHYSKTQSSLFQSLWFYFSKTQSSLFQSLFARWLQRWCWWWHLILMITFSSLCSKCMLSMSTLPSGNYVIFSAAKTLLTAVLVLQNSPLKTTH